MFPFLVGGGPNFAPVEADHDERFITPGEHEAFGQKRIRHFARRSNAATHAGMTEGNGDIYTESRESKASIGLRVEYCGQDRSKYKPATHGGGTLGRNGNGVVRHGGTTHRSVASSQVC